MIGRQPIDDKILRLTLVEMKPMNVLLLCPSISNRSISQKFLLSFTLVIDFLLDMLPRSKLCSIRSTTEVRHRHHFVCLGLPGHVTRTIFQNQKKVDRDIRMQLTMKPYPSNTLWPRTSMRCTKIQRKSMSWNKFSRSDSRLHYVSKLTAVFPNKNRFIEMQIPAGPDGVQGCGQIFAKRDVDARFKIIRRC